MLAKTNVHKKINRTKAALTALSAWAVVLAVLLDGAVMERSFRQPALVNMVRPVYAYTGLDLLNRNDNENETVHLPTRFDIGLQAVAVAGRK